MLDSLLDGWDELSREEKQDRIDARFKFVNYSIALVRYADAKLAWEKINDE